MMNLVVILFLLHAPIICSSHPLSTHSQISQKAPQSTGYMVLLGNGSVPITNANDPFANNALDGRDFLVNHLGLSLPQIENQTQLALEFWLSRFGVDGEALERAGNASIREYQINPLVNERVYEISWSCITPAPDYQVLDGGFQLLITATEGVEGKDPVTGGITVFPLHTNLLFSWLIIQNCLADDIVLPYKSSTLVELTLGTILFDLDIETHEKNPFGKGRSRGYSAPVVNKDTLTNRLYNYITFGDF